MSKTKVVLNISRLAIPQKIEKARFIVQSMTGNVNFPTPSPDLASITASIDQLEKLHLAAMGGGKEDRAAVEPQSNLLDKELYQLSSYVEKIIIGKSDEETLSAVLSSGMDVKDSTTRGGITTFMAINGDPGEVKLAAPFNYRAVFHFQMTTTPADENSFQTISMNTRAKVTMKGLTSGLRYFFRVCIIGKDGPEPWSNPVNLIVT